MIMGTSLEKVWLILLKGIGSIALWLIFQERRRLDPNELFRVGKEWSLSLPGPDCVETSLGMVSISAGPRLSISSGYGTGSRSKSCVERFPYKTFAFPR